MTATVTLPVRIDTCDLTIEHEDFVGPDGLGGGTLVESCRTQIEGEWVPTPATMLHVTYWDTFDGVTAGREVVVRRYCGTHSREMIQVDADLADSWGAKLTRARYSAIQR